MTNSTSAQRPFCFVCILLVCSTYPAIYYNFPDKVNINQASYSHLAGFFTVSPSVASILALLLILFWFIRKLRSELKTKNAEVQALKTELRELKKDLDHAQNVAHIGSWRINVNQDKITWSDETYRIFNLSTREDLSYQKFLSLVHPEDRELITRNWENALKGDTYDVEHRIVCGDEIKWVREKADLEFDEQGNLLGAFGIAQDITELKCAEEELKSSRQRLERIAETSPDIIFILDLNSDKNVYANRSVSGLLGYSQEEFSKIERITKKVIHHEDVKRMNEFYSGMKTAVTGEIREISHRVIHKDGSVRWMDIRATPFSWSKEGCLSEIIGIARDITERKTQEKALMESERRFRQLADSMPQVVWTAKPNGTVDYYNSRAYELDGISQVAREEWKWEPVLHEDDIAPTVNAWNKALAEGTTYEIAHRVKIRGGELRWYLSRGIPVKDKHGKIIRWYGTGTDIHVQKEIETKLNYTLSQLAQSENKLNEAQKLAHIGSYLYDLRTEHIEASHELYCILELPEKTNSLTIRTLIRKVKEEDLSRIVKIINSAIQNKKGIDEEIRYIGKTGLKYLRIVAKPMEKDGKVTKLFGTAMDITEQKTQDEKLKILLTELQRSNKDLEQFAYTASHDLQEPIRMIKSYAQLLEMKHKTTLDYNAQQYLHFITEGASRMQQLVNDLLSYSRVSTHKQELELINVSSVLKTALDDLKFRIAEEHAVIEYSLLPDVKGDKTQIRQLFQNLIQNSLKFRSEDNPVIRINCVKRKYDWLFSVSDNGIGIDAQYFEKIFVIFQRLHDRERYSGTGVGLAICKKIVERHGGEIYVESLVNKGTTFYFTIPFNGA